MFLNTIFQDNAETVVINTITTDYFNIIFVIWHIMKCTK